MGTEEMKDIAKAISLALEDVESNRKKVLEIVDDLCNRFPLYPGGLLK